jgi:hypothetical protein
MIPTSGTSQNWKQKEPCCPHTILRAWWAGWWHQPFFQLVKFRQKIGIKIFNILKMRWIFDISNCLNLKILKKNQQNFLYMVQADSQNIYI